MNPNIPVPVERWPDRFAGWPAPVRYGVILAFVVLIHATLLHLPYFWDEGGYYVPAALDFYRYGTLIPQFTNAHPPLPNVVLASIWHVFGYHIVVTRLTACAFAAAGLMVVFDLGRRLLGAGAGLALMLLSATYPIWFAQSSLAHADIFAAAFSLGGVAVYLTNSGADPSRSTEAAGPGLSPGSSRQYAWAALLFTLAVLAKETAVVQPLALAAYEAFQTFQGDSRHRRTHLRWLVALASPVPILALWFGYHRLKTGFTFGNPTFLRYNATANFTVTHVATAFGYRFLHLFWQRNIWLPILFALACFFLPRRSDRGFRSLPPHILRGIALLVVANWVAFSILGGALLTRYLLPVYPLILLVCIWVWQRHTRHWPWLAALTLGAFVSAWWLNPPTYFAPEDNLTYRDMIVVHQEAITYLAQHDPNATVLTAWPAAGELLRPELGYADHAFKVYSIEDFTRGEISKAAEQPGRYDMALIFATHYVSPSLQSYFLSHPNSRRGLKFARQRDLSPTEIAVMLGGRVVWEDDRKGEWAAVLHFNRRYDASLRDVPGDVSSSSPNSPRAD
ncbi:MAG: ArnT family glycosyltransferase [Janthinobacterium lividum]